MSTSVDRGFFHTELGKRVMSAIVMLVVVLWISWVGGWLFTGLSVLLSAILFYEWRGMVQQTPLDSTEALLTAGFAAFMLAGLLGYAIPGLIAFLILGLILEISSSGAEKTEVRWIGLGALYCAIPALAFPLIRDTGGFSLILFVAVIVWTTDIAAYFFGRQFGGPKLWSAISPKKTWSGAAGGLACAMLVALLFAVLYPLMPVGLALLAACGLSVISQMGDLFESWVKRLFDVKDSSQLIPGHGGFLDRLDGLVAACLPVALLLAMGSI